MIKFYEVLKRSRRNVSKELYYLDDDVQSLYKLIRNYYKENPEASNSEVYDYFLDLFYQESQDLLTLPTIRSDTIKCNTCRYLLEHPEEIRISYEKLHREECAGKKSSFSLQQPYSSNRLSAIRKMTQEVLNVIRTQKESLTPEFRESAQLFFKAPKKVQNEYRKKISSAQRRELDTLKDMFTGDEPDQIRAYLKKCESNMRNDLREDYINILVFLGNKFEKYGFFEGIHEGQQSILKKLGFEELEYPLDKDEENTTSIKNFFKREKLEELDGMRLSILSAFWLNRYTKKLTSLNRSLAMISQLNIWDKIKSAVPNQGTGEISINIDQDELEAVCEKMNFLHTASAEVFDMAQNLEDGDAEVKSTHNSKVLQVDVEPILRDLDNEYRDEYIQYFSNSLPDIDHNFIKDLDDFRILENAVSNTYRLKDMNLIAILSNLYSCNYSGNWGIIFEENKDVRNTDKILIGIDIEGLNMPVRLHAKKSDVLDFLIANQNVTYFPIYEGADDFNVQGKRVGTPVLMPLYGKQKEGIKSLKAKQSDESYKQKFLAHLSFLADRTQYPDHLKVEKVMKKKGKLKIVKEIPAKRYVDLNTGEQFTLGENNEIIPYKQREERVK